MLENIIKTIKRTVLIAGLSAIAGCDCSSGVPGSKPGCVDEDNDTFYSQADCGTEVDCDDSNNAIFPGAPEFCDYKDNNCNGEADEGEGIAKTYCRDQDGDLYGDKNKTKKSCYNIEDAPDGEMLEGYVNDCTDCDDTDASRWKIVDGYMDNDGDSYAIGELQEFCSGDLPVGYIPLPKGEDCDDMNIDIHPGAMELCDNLDQDCDGNNYNGFNVGEMCTAGVGECKSAGLYECAPDGLGTLCNAVPGTPVNEVCDGLDNDCNEEIDDNLTPLSQPCSAGLGECFAFGLEYQVCTGVNGWSGIYLNCDAVPGEPAAELCDGLDNDCNGEIDGFTQSVGCPISTEDYTPEYLQECVGGEWLDVNIEDCPECLPGTLEELCCGYDGLGTKTRFCLAGGEWEGDFSDCTIGNTVNVSNWGGPDNQPSINNVNNYNLTFTRGSGTSAQIYVVSTMVSSEDLMPVEGPDCVSCSGVSEPGSVDCGLWDGNCDWTDHWCYDSSLSEEKVAFECTWLDNDPVGNDDTIDYGFLYVKNVWNSTLPSLNLYSSTGVLGYTPSISGESFVFQRSNGTIEVRDSTNGALVNNFGAGGPLPDIDGDYVAFTSNSTGIVRVYLGDITTGTAELISGVGANDTGYRPSIQGNDIVFYSPRNNNVSQLFHYNISTGSLEQLTDCNSNYDPDIHNRKVAFERNTSAGDKEIYVCDLEQTIDCCADATNISNNPSFDYDPSISACKVAYVSNQTGNEEIFVYDLCEGGCEGE